MKRSGCVVCALIETSEVHPASAIIASISMGISMGRDGSRMNMCRIHTKKFSLAMKKVNKKVGVPKPTLQ